MGTISKKYILLLVIPIVFIACGGSSSSSESTNSTSSTSSSSSSESTNSTSSTSSTTTDITDVLLTNRSENCEDYIKSYTSNVTDIQEDTQFTGTLDIELSNDKCVFTSNSIPNHNFNDITAHFATNVSEVTLDYSITTNPSFATSSTDLSLGTNGIMLNGVKLDIIAAGCYGVGDGNIGCNDMSAPFRYDPMSDLVNFGTDVHNAHTQPTGQYHYHGDPNALYNQEISSPIESSVIGFANDGFPIFGLYYTDTNDAVQKATSSYQLKTGARTVQDGVTPPTNTDGSYKDYDGSFRDDYEYVSGLGVLDECNGMTIDGIYGYYVTETFPWVINCFQGSTQD